MAVEKTIVLKADADDAIKKVDELKEGVKETSEAAGDSKKSFQKMKSGVSAVGLAFKAMGIGLIVSAFAKLSEMLGQNQVVMDKISIASERMGFIFQKVIDVAVKLGEKLTSAFSDPKQAVLDLWVAIKENIANRIEALIETFKAFGTVIKGVFTLDMELIKEGAAEAGDSFVQLATGMDKVQQTEFIQNIKETAKEFKKVTTEASAYAKAIVALRNEVKLAEANQRQLQLVYQKDAELQRQIRDDISLTFEERIAANEELGRILDEQFAEEQALAQKKIDLAQMELNQNKDNIDLQVALINAKTEMADLDERITGQRSEQLTNLKALEAEQLAIEEEKIATENARKQKIIDDAAALRQKEIDDAQAQADKLLAIKEKEAAEELAIQKAKEEASKAMALGAGQSILQTVGRLAGEGTKTAKAAALAGILIDTAKGISGAIAAGAGVPFPANLGAIATGVASVLAGIANAKGIFAKVGGGDDNVDTPTSIDTGSAGAGGMGALIPNIENIEQPTLGGTDQASIQAYVIENDISNAQALQQELDTQATL